MLKVNTDAIDIAVTLYGLGIRDPNLLQMFMGGQMQHGTTTKKTKVKSKRSLKNVHGKNDR